MGNEILGGIATEMFFGPFTFPLINKIWKEQNYAEISRSKMVLRILGTALLGLGPFIIGASASYLLEKNGIPDVGYGAFGLMSLIYFIYFLQGIKKAVHH